MLIETYPKTVIETRQILFCRIHHLHVDVVEVRVFKMRSENCSHAHWATDLPHMLGGRREGRHHLGR